MERKNIAKKIVRQQFLLTFMKLKLIKYYFHEQKSYQLDSDILAVLRCGTLSLVRGFSPEPRFSSQVLLR